MAFPANPYFWPESTKHDVTLTSLAAILSYSQCFPFDTMRKIDVQEGTESFATIDALVYEILRKNLRGAKNSPPPPPGRGLKAGSRLKRRLIRRSPLAAAGCSARLGVHPADVLSSSVAGNVVGTGADHLQAVFDAAGVVGLAAEPGHAHVAAVQRVPGALVAEVVAAHVHMSSAAAEERLPEHQPESVAPRAGQLSVGTERGAVGVGVVPVAGLTDVLVAVRVEEHPVDGARALTGAAAEFRLADVAVDAVVVGRDAVDLLSVSVRQQHGPGGGDAGHGRRPGFRVVDVPDGAVAVEVLDADPLEGVGSAEEPQGEVGPPVVRRGQIAARVPGSARLLSGVPGERRLADVVRVAAAAARQRAVSRAPAGRLGRLRVADDARVVAARLRAQTRHREEPAGAVLGERVGRALVVADAAAAGGARHMRVGAQSQRRRGRQHIWQLLERVSARLRHGRRAQQLQQRPPHGFPRRQPVSSCLTH